MKKKEKVDCDAKLYKHCPICGYFYDEDGILGSKLKLTYEICDCCGCEYGYTDTSRYRQSWIEDGYPWFMPSEKPDNWKPTDQLKNADLSWRNIISQ